MMDLKPRIAYIMSRFPGLSETFILREMCELQSLGWDIIVYPLVYQHEAVVHDEVALWINRTRRSSLFQVFIANLLLLIKQPIVYLSTLWQCLTGNIKSLKFLSRALVVFPEAVWMARQMQMDGVAQIHAHYATHPALAGWVIQKISAIPYGVTVHAHDIFVDKSMLKTKLTDARYIVAISEYNRNYLRDLYGDAVAKKTSVIHCGILPTLHFPGEDARSNSIWQIASIGSLRDYKGFTYLLHACKILKEKNVKFRCFIVGGGELFDELNLQITTLNIGDVVELLGPKAQHEVADILKQSDCYVQPSIITPSGKMEGIPVSIMEAMASGLPVVATDISGISELVRHEETGLLVKEKDAYALAGALLRIYQNPKTARGYSEAGRDLVMNQFTIKGSGMLLSRLFVSTFEDNSWK